MKSWRGCLITAFCLLSLLGARSSAQTNSKPDDSSSKFDLSKIDSAVVKVFREAWSRAGLGRLDSEVVILIYRLLDNSYKAILQNHTNEARQATFRWIPNAIAIVHTHPNKCSPEPSDEDIRIAEKFNVPMFTLASSGMYMYDPDNETTVLVKEGYAWLEPSKWKQKPVLVRVR